MHGFPMVLLGVRAYVRGRGVRGRGEGSGEEGRGGWKM